MPDVRGMRPDPDQMRVSWRLVQLAAYHFAGDALGVAGRYAFIIR